MWLDQDAPIRKHSLVFARPFVNTPGTLGFAPDPHSMPYLEHLGAFITHPISRAPRTPAKNRCCLPFPGGFLLHTGLPNPGINRAIAQYKKTWAGAPLPVIAHLMVEDPGSLAEMIRKLEGLENLMALELGLPLDCDASRLSRIMAATAGELPAIPCLSPAQIPVLLQPLLDLQPAAVHLTGPRGTLPNAAGNWVTGRLYGPAIFPLMFQSVKILIDAGLPVIAEGGIQEDWQAEALTKAGCLAVALGAVLWEIAAKRVFPSDVPLNE